MIRIIVLLVAFLLTTLPAQAAPIVFSAVLDGPSESPSNASPATGFATVTIDDVAHTMRVEATFAGLLGTTTASHIHVINGPGDTNTADTNGPVATTTPSFVGFPLGVTAGSFDQTYNMLLTSSYRSGWITDSGGSTTAAEAALFAGIVEGRAYLNIHTQAFGGGEIRGFLQPAAIPEPASLVLIGSGLVAAGLRRRRQRARSRA